MKVWGVEMTLHAASPTSLHARLCEEMRLGMGTLHIMNINSHLYLYKTSSMCVVYTEIDRHISSPFYYEDPLLPSTHNNIL